MVCNFRITQEAIKAEAEELSDFNRIFHNQGARVILHEGLKSREGHIRAFCEGL